MQRDKRLIAPFIFFTVGFIFLVLIPNLTQSDPNLATCYHGKVGSSNSLMQITDQNGVEVNGTLIFQNYEKDSSYGSFSGKYIDNKLTATFEFNSEGSQSVREISFTKEGKNLIGDGFTYQVIEECSSVLYNQGLGLIPFDMKLPLHLFPQMKLQQISDEQINWTFGPGGFKPIQSAKIVYTPPKGDPVDAVVFYLWQKSVWDVIANPNEAPDWGVMQWSDQANVFSVNGVQDCVYPNEPDCGNVSEIYNFIYDKNSYIK